MSSIRFTIKPVPVIVEHRPLYKISQLLLVLHISSRGGKSSLARLQLFNWALKTAERSEILVRAAITEKLDVSGWGFDPAVPIALRFAIAERLVEDVSSGYKITTTGETFVKVVIKEGHLEKDKDLLSRVSKKITESMVVDVARSWMA